ncbi:hypothetical protein MCOR27_003071 [Pyricularia oryzae]|uniref:Lysophospholipase n=1 Tax=Pyricularia grisea TaxID=148305 RepID=A0ABQ8NHY1_PYRGI|nr:hypothetical protein MCOR01_009065 [Pyricularia oryzae]KAI6297363.1 hypothetical protein MCOR33_006272 [Pyricularia grisea]KAI6259889.1 hypothetical protein MCOR19_003813 [Pyricularia oryzae]KAI6274155.1 hypothetical protein MCOR26_006618 [Pyricularia oryzae]KAI6283878.1 hypothetical protein MCOR27_003071 [Pyricularia oryzae]
MRFLHLLSILAAASAKATPVEIQQQREPQLEGETIERRALPDSPSGGYAPVSDSCPSNRPTVRSAATGISPDEASWLPNRRKNTVKPMSDFLTRANIQGFNAADYISKFQSNMTALPNIALAFSGGGYRALLNGAGFIKAADERTPGTTGPGGIGGLLQSATYMSGLSGGSWLLGSVFNNNFSSIGDLQQNPNVWKFDRTIFVGPKTSRSSVKKLIDSAAYWKDIIGEVEGKSKAGFLTSITDYWGRALSYQLIDDVDGGDQYLFSSIAQTSDFQAGNYPMPMIVANGRKPDSVIISLNSTVFEFNPFEMGTWDPTTSGFAPLQYVGSNFEGGVVPSSGKCVRGFDQSSFVMGTSSSLFNAILLRIEQNNTGSQNPAVPETVAKLIKALGPKIQAENRDVASWKPNPFFGFHPDTAGGIASSAELSLVDGGLDGQNIPLLPLIQPVRKVDVIYAIDSSADTSTSFPNGSAILHTFQRSQSQMGNGVQFPAVPDVNTFVNLGLNNRPVFFGCDVNAFKGPQPPPLVVYMPNAPYSAFSNSTTFTMKYEENRRDAIIANAFDGATQGLGSLDKEWPACVACAALQRSMLRTNTQIPTQCQSCFTRYCWDGKTDTTPRGKDFYQPTLKLTNGGSQPPQADIGGQPKKKSISGKLLVPSSSAMMAGSLALVTIIFAML